MTASVPASPAILGPEVNPPVANFGSQPDTVAAAPLILSDTPDLKLSNLSFTPSIRPVILSMGPITIPTRESKPDLNQPIMPSGLLDGLRTMTANIMIEMGYATDLHRGALVATGVVLFVFIMAINLLVSLIKRKGGAGK